MCFFALPAVLGRLWHAIPDKHRYSVYALLIKIGLSLYGPTNSGRCFRLPFNLYAKRVAKSEVHAMRYIVQHTTIPIPLVLDSVETPKGLMIIMNRMRGGPLLGHLKGMPVAERAQLAMDLRMCFDQLRSLEPPSTKPLICGIDGDSFMCYRVSAFDRIGPFATELDFDRCLVYEHTSRPHHDRLFQLCQDHRPSNHKITLSHNDLTPFNILIDSNNRLSGIIDWECTAWLPNYWEYTRSYFHREGYPEWRDLMDNIFTPWPKELEVERELWIYGSPL